MNPSVARNYLLSTDFPIDKVVIKIDSSSLVSQGTNPSDSILITIPHSLGFAPLCIGTYTDDPTWSVSWSVGSPPQFFNPGFGQWSDRIVANFESDASNIYIRLLNYDTTRTLYFRLTGLAPAVVNSLPEPIGFRSSYRINTDWNYLKILIDTKSNYPNPTGITTISVPHNLGYRPRVLVFSELDGITRRSGSENTIGVTGISTVTRVTDTDVLIDVDSFLTTLITLNVRVYIDA